MFSVALYEALDAFEIELPVEAKTQLEAFADLLREWNPVASLVSKGDLDRIFAEHIPDSLSLLPYLPARGEDSGGLLDVGSGGGFPALPIKVMRPSLHLTLVERNLRKAAFLRTVIAKLGLGHVSVVQESFPEGLDSVRPACYTARAVEDPERVIPAIGEHMRDRSVFLCQREGVGELLGERFHVERIDDEWSLRNLRRGPLYRIEKRFHA